jgi:ubiquinone/menaquinone biosynthesis C-methylase UbiE
MAYSYRGYPTIDNFWDTYYTENHDIYDRFALSSISAVDDIQVNYGFSGKKVLDIGGGSGKSTFHIAQYAHFVISIEPSISFRSFAIEKQKRLGINNVKFIEGVGEDLSQFKDGEFDCAVTIHSLPIFWEDIERCRRDVNALVDGCLRVVKPGCYFALASTTPGWLKDHEVKGMKSFPDPNIKDPTAELLKSYPFTYRDNRVILDYGTVNEALATWGFIYGKKAIDYIIDYQISKFSWSLRIYHLKI